MTTTHGLRWKTLMSQHSGSPSTLTPTMVIQFYQTPTSSFSHEINGQIVICHVAKCLGQAYAVLCLLYFPDPLSCQRRKWSILEGHLHMPSRICGQAMACSVQNPPFPMTLFWMPTALRHCITNVLVHIFDSTTRKRALELWSCVLCVSKYLMVASTMSYFSLKTFLWMNEWILHFIPTNLLYLFVRDESRLCSEH